jgi:hypothetical protein
MRRVSATQLTLDRWQESLDSRGKPVFVIRLANGEEVQGSDGDELEINQETGVLSVSRVDGFEEITTHYSPSAWLSVTHRKRGTGVRPSLISSTP